MLRRLAEPEPPRHHTAVVLRARLTETFGGASVPPNELAPWVAQNCNPEDLFAPRGWTKETLATKQAFNDEIMRRRRFSRGIEEDWRIEAEAYLALGGGSLDARLHWIETLKSSSRLDRKRGPAPHVNVARDAVIWVYVNIVCLLGRLNPTRNDASEKPSGCSVISDAMTIRGTPIAEKTIAGIYRQFERKLEEEDDRQQWIEGEIARGK